MQTKTITNGISAQFPRTWKATAAYHTPGQELLGDDIDTGEVVVTVDDILTASFAVADLDTMLSHFDVRSEFSAACGRELAKIYDKNIFRSIILSARASADGPFPAGQNITNAALTNTGTIDGKAWLDAIIQAQQLFDDVDVPDSEQRYAAVNKRVFDAIKYAKDANGRYMVLGRDSIADQSSGTMATEYLEIEGVRIFKTRNLPKTNETADTSVYSKYRANYATTTGIIWTPMAACAAKLMDITVESTRDVRRLEDFQVSKMLAGHGKLRPECAIEIKTS